MNHYFNLRKRGLALFVALMMCLSLLPGTALAGDGKDDGKPHFCTGGNHVMVSNHCMYCDYVVNDTENTIAPEEKPTEPAKPGETGNPEEKVDSAECTHEYGEDWHSDDSTHWYTCTKCSAKDMSTESKHAFDFAGKCSVCGYAKPNAHVCTKFDETDHCTVCEQLNPNHTHSFGDSGKCICGEEHTTHNVVSWMPNYSNDDFHTGNCTVCGQKVEEEHTFGASAWGRKTCTKCIYFVEETGEQEHTHEYKYTYSGNNKHIGDCQNGDCTAKTIIEACVFNQKGEDATRDYCICGNSKSNVVDLNPGQDGCTHVYGTSGVNVDQYSHKLTCVNCQQEKIEACELDTLEENSRPIAYYCRVCGQQTPIRQGDKPYCTDNQHEWEPEKEVLSADGKSVLTTLKCKNCEFTYITEICNTPSKVLVHYVYEDGRTAHADQEQTVINGTAYSITSPTIDGYEPDMEVVSGTSDGKGLDVTVTYKEVAKTYTLTIKYEKEGGKEVHTAYVATLTAGAEYDVKSPELYGYAPEHTYVKGTMPDADEVVTVKYEPITYTWTIVYVDKESGKELGTIKKNFTVETVKSLGDVKSPDFDGYSTEQKSVRSPSPDTLGDKHDKVEYTPVKVEPAKYPLVIKYENLKGEEIFPAHTASLEAGEEFDVKSPELSGYKPEQEYVKGNMPVGGEKVTVKYEPITYTWTINYVDEDGRQVADPFTQDFTVETIKALTAQTSPTVAGHTPAQTSVPAPTELRNVTDRVVYKTDEPTPDTHTVTYAWNLPAGATATLPTGGSYEAGEQVVVDTTYTNGTEITVNGTTYVFSGWNTGNFTMPNENVTISGTWSEREPDEPTPPTPPVTPPTPVDPVTPPATIPDTATPLDPGDTIADQEVPLANTIGLNDTDHFAYVIGYDDDTVRPLSNITRAEAVTIFFRLMTEEYRTANWSTENTFSDVNAGDWYNNAISTVQKAGALAHFAQDDAFLPDQAITRAEFAAIAAGFVSDEITGDEVGDFSDTEGHWAAEAIRKAVQAGWITGKNGNSFAPDECITRAEVMSIVNRMLDRTPDKDHMLPEMKKWTDNPEDAWYYEAVQEATNEHDYERDELAIETWTLIKEHRDWAALELGWAANNGATKTEA